MELAAIMDEVATVLEQLTGVNVSAFPPGSVVPPAGVVAYPDRIEYDATYGRGVDRIRDLSVVLLVGKATSRAARDKVSLWSKGSGAGSLKTSLEAHQWASCDLLVATQCEFDVVTVAGVDYLAALFSLDIAGKSSPE